MHGTGHVRWYGRDELSTYLGSDDRIDFDVGVEKLNPNVHHVSSSLGAEGFTAGFSSAGRQAGFCCCDVRELACLLGWRR